MSNQASGGDYAERLDVPAAPQPWWRWRKLWPALKRAVGRVALNGAAIATLLVAVIATAYYFVDRMMQLHTEALAKQIEGQSNVMSEKIEGQSNVMSEKIDGQSNVIAEKFDAMADRIDAVDKRLTDKIDAVGSDVERLEQRLWDIRSAEMAASTDDYAALAATHDHESAP